MHTRNFGICYETPNSCVISAALPRTVVEHCRNRSTGTVTTVEWVTRKRQRLESVKVAANPANPQAAIEIPTHLNNTPHSRDVRKWFYKDVTEAIQRAVKDGEKRLTIRCTIPELNPEFDVFRIGTLLELVRDIATSLAQDGKRVKVCVQQSMGQGVFQSLPLSLSGVRKIMERMEWGDAEEFVTLGSVGEAQIDDSHYYVLIAPQNMVGQTIVKPLLEMVEAGEKLDKQIILINPLLKDVQSSSNVMSVSFSQIEVDTLHALMYRRHSRGRKERVEFTQSFLPIYHFRLLYLSGAGMYPIMGAMRMTYKDKWRVYKRADIGKREEEYQLLGEFDEEPSSSDINPLFKAKPQKPKWKTYYNP